MSIEKRLERIEAILDARGLDWDHPRVEEDHFADANKMAVEEPPRKWRILGPGEVVCSIDRVKAKASPPSDPPDGLGWCRVDASVGTSVFEDDPCVFARPVVDEPAKEPEPAWEPKVGDWVRVTRPDDWIEWRHPRWGGAMHVFEGRVGQIERESEGHFHIRGLVAWNGFRYQFHRDWLSPAEPPATEKPAEPEYREPVLPADADKKCDFSDDGQSWLSGWVYGWVPGRNWVTLNNNSWKHARIKKES